MIGILLAQTIALTGGTVFPVAGPKLEHATVLIRDGRIVAVGANVAVPPDATRIDATGKWITPGLIDGGNQMGLTEIGAVRETNDAAVRNDTVAASFNVAEGINPASTLIPITRMAGVTTALAAPAEGLIRGQAVLIDLDGATIEAMLVKSPVAMVAEAQMHPLAAPATDLQALGAVVRGELPLIVVANRRSDIETALRIAREYHLKLILAEGAEAWQVADAIARAGVPVLVQPLDNIPSYDGLGVRYENAALLAKAGVKVALLETDTHNARNLRQQAGNAVSNGMTWDQALRAVTLSPAEIFGVADRYGSLAAGKVADVVVWSGDPFEFATAVEHVFIRGREIPLRSRQTELLERYRKLPPTY